MYCLKFVKTSRQEHGLWHFIPLIDHFSDSRKCLIILKLDLPFLLHRTLYSEQDKKLVI